MIPGYYHGLMVLGYYHGGMLLGYYHGGMIPGYYHGGMILGYYQHNALKHQILNKYRILVNGQYTYTRCKILQKYLSPIVMLYKIFQ